jgi:hypothetical protein
MGSRAWTDQEDAICRAAIAQGLDLPSTVRELERWGWRRSTEATAAHLTTLRKREKTLPADVEMLRYSISRRWL